MEVLYDRLQKIKKKKKHCLKDQGLLRIHSFQVVNNAYKESVKNTYNEANKNINDENERSNCFSALNNLFQKFQKA